MIYLDNAATSYPKPRSVANAVKKAFHDYGGNPGRSSHRLSMETSRMIYDTRCALADLLNFGKPENIVFTKNATEALNIVIKCAVGSGDHILFSSLEHNSVCRPVWGLEKSGVESGIFGVDVGDDVKTAENMVSAIRKNTRLIICTHASNVCGKLMPVVVLGRLAKERGLLFAVDAAQSAGLVNIDLSGREKSVDFLALPGHKGLYGPCGTGALVCRNAETLLRPYMEGGSGTDSLSREMPPVLPERFEAGTLAPPAICGLKKGIEFVASRGADEIFGHESELCGRAFERLAEMPGVKIIRGEMPLLLLTFEGRSPEAAAEWLDGAGICVRSGLHCAPLAHRTVGTESTGGLRVSFGYFNKRRDADKLCGEIKKFVKSQ